MAGMLVNFIVGFVVSKNAAAGATIRKLIPAINFVLALVTQIVASANSALPPAVPAVAMAGFFGTFGKGFLDTLLNALIQTLVVTGAHSGTKNVYQGVKGAKK
jgi:hypothetical protein